MRNKPGVCGPKQNQLSDSSRRSELGLSEGNGTKHIARARSKSRARAHCCFMLALATRSKDRTCTSERMKTNAPMNRYTVPLQKLVKKIYFRTSFCESILISLAKMHWNESY